MFQGRHLRPEVGRQSAKNVAGRTVSANLQKLIILFYGLIKMTNGLPNLESEPDFIAAAKLENFIDRTPGDQWLNITHFQRLALKIKWPFPQQSRQLSHKFVAAILEEHLFYAQLYLKW